MKCAKTLYLQIYRFKRVLKRLYNLYRNVLTVQFES